MELYVEDILVKSKEAKTHIDDLREALATFRRYQMKLNPTKYAFKVVSGKLLGFMIPTRGWKPIQKR